MRRLITTILDPVQASVEELAALYPQRWEIEIAIKEGKTVLRKGRIILRGKKSELAEEEFWGKVLAHYPMRKIMAHAALDRKRDPDEPSYEGSIEFIESTLSGPVLSFPPKKRLRVFALMYAHIGATKTARNRGRSKHRVIKAKPRPIFPVRKREDKAIARVHQTTVIIV